MLGLLGHPNFRVHGVAHHFFALRAHILSACVVEGLAGNIFGRRTWESKKAAWPRSGIYFFLGNILGHPIGDEFGDLIAIFLQHHLVAVAVDVYGFERHELRVHAGLVEPFCEAGIVFAVIAALSREINDREFSRD